MRKMDHGEAARKLAVEQYLLGEMSEAERQEFEEHFFACSDCAESLQAGVALVGNARAVLSESNAFAPAREGKRWWPFGVGWGLAPAAAFGGWAVAAVLAGILLLHAPTEVARLTLGPAVSVRAVRAEQTLTFSRQKGIITFTVAHEWEDPFTGYEGELERAADQNVVVKSRMAAPDSGSTPLAVSIRPEGLQAGSYYFQLYGLREGSAERKLVERITFTLTE
jgi:anti-sigma factor RsiW